MTTILSGQEVSEIIASRFPEAIVETGSQAVVIKSEFLLQAAEYLKSNPLFAFHLLDDITSVDYYDYFEVIYRLTSLEHNTGLTLKVRCYDRDKPTLPSVISIWQGADFMEREIFDLMGIAFTGHPSMKRIFLWEGFSGHPLRKDFL